MNTRYVRLFTRHPVASNLLMIIMILAGLWALTRLNVQFLPNYTPELAQITVVWPGATAEDIEKSLINPMEQELRDLDNLDKMNSTARMSNALLTLEFYQGTDMGTAMEDIRQRIAQIRHLPTNAETPIITRILPYETVAKLIITGPDNLDELRPLVFQFERELLDLGIAKIDIVGLPEDEIAIQIPILKLAELKLSLNQIAKRIAARSQDLPAGTIGKDEVGRQLRGLEQRRDIQGFERLPLITKDTGQLILLRDIASIKRRAQDESIKLFSQGQPAIELRLLRTPSADALKSAKILTQWLVKTRETVGNSLQIQVYDEKWHYISERIHLLLKNGVGGLILILMILFLMLNKRVAFWVSVGIPVSFMAALAILYFLGGSINMVSLFAFIMTLGIIVDDTIVVGEETLTNIHRGKPALQAVESAAHKMLAPIVASSLTTIAAFLPLFLLTGVIGTILFEIPLVVTCVILASLVECFLVLPGHLYHAFTRHPQETPTKVRQIVNQGFQSFQSGPFKQLITWVIKHRLNTLVLALFIWLGSVALILNGYIHFNFFPSPEGKIIVANIQFNAGTPTQSVKAFLDKLENAAKNVETTLTKGENKLIQALISYQNRSGIRRETINRGEEFASVTVELTSPDQRSISNEQFIQAWRSEITLSTDIDNLSMSAPRAGPPGEDIDIELSNSDPNTLKKAALALQGKLQTYVGVSNIKDDTPYAQQQWIYTLTPAGHSLNLTIESVGNQLRSAFNGEVVQIFYEPNEEIEVRVMLPDNERYRLATLEQFPIFTPLDQLVPLGTVVNLSSRKAPNVLRHTDTQLSIHVTADVENTQNNTNEILADLEKNFLPSLKKQYPVRLSFKGKAEEQAETFTDMKYGLVLAFSFIYIILAWVFRSYVWPLIVMIAIPLGLTGAILGHALMGIDLTILSLFGFFGLSGIVINDSIILLTEYRTLREKETPIQEAIIMASCRRLRAVLLTSLTTIAGLTPLLFETSVQAQFLIPMATSLSFGLAYATLLILLVVPALLTCYETVRKKHAY